DRERVDHPDEDSAGSARKFYSRRVDLLCGVERGRAVVLAPSSTRCGHGDLQGLINHMPDYEPAVILSACRTAIGSFGGTLKDLSASDLGAVVIREAIRRADVQPSDLGDVLMGCVLQGGAGMNVARQAAIKAGVPHDVPAETVNRVCGSGLQAVVHAVEA